MLKLLVSVLFLIGFASPAQATEGQIKCWESGPNVKCRFTGIYRVQQFEIYTNRTELTPSVYTERDFVLPKIKAKTERTRYRGSGVIIKCTTYNGKRFCSVRSSYKYKSIKVSTIDSSVRLFR